jgi:wobble nucleotide-excising tRNase
VKIDRINKIKNYRIFSDFEWPNELQNFSRFNLIYGWNGSGKTTLSCLFDHLQKQKNTVDAEIIIQIDGTSINGNTFSDSVIPQVRVFNRDTVNESIFKVADHEIDPIFYLGKDSSEKQSRIEALKIALYKHEDSIRSLSFSAHNKREQLDKSCKGKAAEIKNLLTTSGGGPYNHYNKSNFITKCNQLLGFQNPAYSLLPEHHNKHLSSKDGTLLDSISPVTETTPNYIELSKQVSELLERSIVTTIISDLAERTDVATWVQRGLELHKDESGSIECHFCKNEISSDRITDLENHFNDKLVVFQAEIDRKIVDIEKLRQSLESLSLPTEAQFYPQYRKDFSAAVSTWTSTKMMVNLYMKMLTKALRSKREQPFRAMNLIEFTSFAASSHEKSILVKVLSFIAEGAQTVSTALGLSALENINRKISEHNQYTDNFDIELKKVRARLETHTASSFLEEYKQTNEEIAQIESSIQTEQEGAEYARRQIVDLESEVKELVQPAEELNKEMADYLGREELRFQVKGNGYVISRRGKPALNLSEGEKTAIAFMYFLKTLEDTSFDKANGIIVIDDPISSLDSNSMYSAFGFMRSRTRDAKQLIVLTHSFAFFRHVRKWFAQEQKLPAIQGHQGSNDYRKAARFYMLETEIVDGVRSASIQGLDPLLRDYESEYQYLFKKLYDFANSPTSGSLEGHYGLPNVARRVLETFLTFKLPNMKPAEIEKKLDKMDFDSAKKNRILRFLHVNSHYDQVGEPEHDLSLLAEGPAVMKDLMELIRVADPDHYDGMSSFSKSQQERDIESNA